MKFQMLGDANKAGPVRLSDVYDSEVGGASTGIAASQKALYDAYNSLNSRMDTWSYSEIICGTWVDGKRIYKKTFTGTSGAGGTTIDISSCKISQPVNVEFVIRNTTNSTYCFDSYNYTDGSDCQAAYMDSTAKRFYFRGGSSFCYGKYYLTIWYTKT